MTIKIIKRYIIQKWIHCSSIVDGVIRGVLYLLQKESNNHKKHITTWYNSAVILLTLNLTLQNSLRRNWVLRQLLFSWLPKHPVFLFIFTIPPPLPPTIQLVKLPMVSYPSLYITCVTYETLCHAISHQVLPTPGL